MAKTKQQEKRKSGQIDIKQSLNKAYRKQRPTRAEIELVRLEFTKMLDRANLKESEEYHKSLLKDFLINTAYSNYFINTKGRIDLVIHNDKNQKSSVGVIIEVKGPGNKTEMPTTDNLNKKAMQELLLYFLRERLTKKNFEIKHLIATNFYEWFIFDANEFEKLAENAKLKKHFKDFEEGRLTSEKTELFYKEIASPVLKQANINFVSFDIHDYEKHLRKQTETGDSKLIELQKILSPTHLLKLPFANDSNTLNKEFYNELLHIIGLEEYKEKSKKLIRRKTKENRNEDSLIEAAITQITSLDKLSQITDVERFGDNVDDRLFNMALELAITWINRILFLKLLESQIVGYQKSKEYIFLNKEKVAGYADLNTLFFQVLAVETKDRQEKIKKKFPKVPYLNSSLFEPTELERQTIFISNIPDDTSLPLYKKTVVNGNNKKMNTLEYLLKFLDAYDFASEGKEEIIDDNKALINASVLGLMYEKINGYKDGSFFTPGFITMYMCRETVRRAVVQKFKEQTDFDSDDFSELINYTNDTYKKAELDKYNGIINSLKICDPAVGSGHFLVSALNEIIAIKAILGILTDDSGKPLRDYLIDVENDELMILDGRGEFFKYDPQNRETCRIQKTLFHEKQTIIENCLFGVDINPNSVSICRLRLWIELLKNAYYKEDGELETLPNIDINIKCGNSLISRYPLDADLKEVLRESRFSIDVYRIAVNNYRNAENKEQKHALEKLIEKIKETFTKGIDKEHPKKKILAKLRGNLIALVDQGALFQTESKKSKQRKFEKLTKNITEVEAEIAELESGVIYRNAFEWRFEFPEVLDKNTGDFTGFDIVIGNPPYGLFNKKQNQKIALSIQKEAMEVLKRDFPFAASGGINACRIFYNLGLNLSCKNGYQSMIIPFGILTDTTSAILRKHIFNNHSFLNIDAFPERDNIKHRVFEDVKMSTAIILTCKSVVSETFNLGVSYSRKIETENRFDLQYDDVIRINPDLCPIPITTPDEYGVLAKIFSEENLIRLGSISKCLTGEADMTFAKKAMSQNKKDAILIKGVQVDRFEVKHDPATISQGEIKYLNIELFKKKYKGKKIKDAYERRIILQGLTGINERFRLKATIIEPTAFLANSCNYLLDKKNMSFSVVLGLINSKLLNFLFKCKSTSSNVNGYEVDDLPIPKDIDEIIEGDIEKLVDKILNAKKNQRADTSDLERKIDQLVYNLYGLTDEEIAIVKGDN
jgi:Alw26I/Eco31I/Esp3I family type II restriction m6 adenine DNA methyltransferase